MNKEVIYAAGGLVAGVVLTLAIGAVCHSKMDHRAMMGNHSMREQESKHTHSMGGAMDMMTGSLKGKSGDEFDKAFIAEMITHHQGAIDMANLALQNAGHQEIKDLAKAIISAQTSEIQQMQQWQNNWYTNKK